MSLLICHFLAAAAFAQSPSNESGIASGVSKVPTCASELERSATPHSIAKDCLLGIGDVVHIEDGKDDTRPSVIGPDGTIAIPLIGKVQAAKVTVSQLTANINMLLAKYVNHPSVMVTVVDNVTQIRYFVEGDVLQPGRYSLVAPITVLEAIDKAEGFKPGANLKIVIQRQATAELKLDYGDLLSHLGHNISVQNGDHVVISRSR